MKHQEIKSIEAEMFLATGLAPPFGHFLFLLVEHERETPASEASAVFSCG